MNIRLLQGINILALIAVIVVNYLSVALPLGGVSQVELARVYANLFTPAGFTFSIWSVIYLGLIAFVIVQAKGLFNSNVTAPAFVSTIGPWFIINCVANMLWLIVWHNKMVLLSLVMMLLLLISLFVIYRKLNIGFSNPGGVERWAVHLPFSIYLGWISVATVANTTVFLTQYGWAPFGEAANYWMVAILGVVVALGAFASLKLKNVAFILVLLWAFYGILSKRQIEETAPFIITVLMVSMVVLALLAIVAFVRSRKAISGS